MKPTNTSRLARRSILACVLVAILWFFALYHLQHTRKLEEICVLPDSSLLAITPEGVFTEDNSFPYELRLHITPFRERSHIFRFPPQQGLFRYVGTSCNFLFFLRFPTPSSQQAQLQQVSLANGQTRILPVSLTPVLASDRTFTYPVAITHNALYALLPETCSNIRRNATLCEIKLFPKQSRVVRKDIPYARNVFAITPYLGILQEKRLPRYRIVIRRSSQKVPIFTDTLMVLHQNGKILLSISHYDSLHPPILLHNALYWVQEVYSPRNNSDYPDHYRVMYATLSNPTPKVLFTIETQGLPAPTLYAYKNNLYLGATNASALTKIWEVDPTSGHCKTLLQANLLTTGQVLFQSTYCYFIKRRFKISWWNWSPVGLGGQSVFTLCRYQLGS